jgi:hypothetical protein
MFERGGSECRQVIGDAGDFVVAFPFVLFKLLVRDQAEHDRRPEISEPSRTFGRSSCPA